MSGTAQRKTTRNAAVVRYYLAGHSLVATGKRFGVAFQRVSVILRDAGVQARPSGRPKKGEGK